MSSTTTHPTIREALRRNRLERKQREKERQERNERVLREAHQRGDLKPSA